MSNKPNKEHEKSNEAILPRSLFVSQQDSRANLREMVNSIFSDRFMIFLSLLLIPLILVSLITTVCFTSIENIGAIQSFLSISDWIIVILFVAEYTSKLYVAEDRWKHFKSLWHLIDLVIIILPFLQYLPLLQLSIEGSPSLLLRLLRVPRLLAVGGRAVAGRRNGDRTDLDGEINESPTIIRQVDSNYKVTEGLTWDDLKAHLTDVNKHEWLDLHYVSDEGFASLSKILGIAEPHFKSALVDDIYPHIDYVKESSFIFLQSGRINYPKYIGNYLTISRSGVITICNGTKIITVSRHSVDLLDKVLQSIGEKKKANSFVVPVLYGILEHMLEDYRSILSEIDLEILKISNTSRSKLPRDFLERIYQLDKEVSRLVSNLSHFKDMLSIITSKKVPLEGFDHTTEEAFHVIQEGATYLNEISHDMIGNLRSIIDLYINETSFETNKILKILAVITAISVIPSAVSGLLGTNLVDTPYGVVLWQLSFIISVSMAFIAYTFIKLGWLKT
jgi:Mg2+ and Co2+ transporter CorA